MVEVFKTNVKESYQASMLLAQIHIHFHDYTANFDLEDCDKILRVKCSRGKVRPSHIIELLKDFEFQAEVLQEDNHSLVQ